MQSRNVAIVRLIFLGCWAGLGGPLHADELRNPREIPSQNGHLEVALKAAVRTHDFPAAQNPNNVNYYKLQSPVYILEPSPPGNDNGELVGPTIRIRKGDHLTIKLLNHLNPSKLPPDVPNPPDNYPQGFASTNLHTHGLHVSPRGLADNIYVEIKPGEEHRYEYDVPRNHVSGTFWYHPHKHGSVALQTTGGMAGALIVDDDKDCPYGRDKYTEQIMVLQQLHGTATCGSALLSPQADDIYDKVKDAEAAAAAAAPGAGSGSSSTPQGSLRFMKAIRIQRALLKDRAAKAKAGAAKSMAPQATGTTPNPPAPLSCDPAPNNPWDQVDCQPAPSKCPQPPPYPFRDGMAPGQRASGADNHDVRRRDSALALYSRRHR